MNRKETWTSLSTLRKHVRSRIQGWKAKLAKENFTHHLKHLCKCKRMKKLYFPELFSGGMVGLPSRNTLINLLWCETKAPPRVCWGRALSAERVFGFEGRANLLWATKNRVATRGLWPLLLGHVELSFLLNQTVSKYLWTMNYWGFFKLCFLHFWHRKQSGNSLESIFQGSIWRGTKLLAYISGPTF